MFGTPTSRIMHNIRLANRPNNFLHQMISYNCKFFGSSFFLDFFLVEHTIGILVSCKIGYFQIKMQHQS